MSGIMRYSVLDGITTVLYRVQFNLSTAGVGGDVSPLSIYQYFILDKNSG